MSLWKVYKVAFWFISGFTMCCAVFLVDLAEQFLLASAVSMLWGIAMKLEDKSNESTH